MPRKEPETDDQKKAREVVEDIASNIARLSRQVNDILGGRLKRETVVVLLMYSTKLPKYQIEAVLSAIEKLEKNYLK